MSFWRKAIAITWKDILIEIRTKEVLLAVLVFTLLVIVIFSFAFTPSQEVVNLVAPGILWVAFAFAGVLSLNRSFVFEVEEDGLEGLMACPVNREVIYVGKVLGSLIFLLVIEAVALPVFAFLFNTAILSLELIAITILTTIGFVAVGTLFSALAVNTRAKELVLPILFLPVVAPIIISAVIASGMALSGETWGGLSSWLQIIGTFDVVFLVVAYLVFSFVIEK